MLIQPACVDILRYESYLCLWLSVSFTVCWFLYVCLYMFVCLYVSIFMSMSLCVCLFVCMLVCMSMFVSLYVCFCVSVFMSVYGNRSVHLSVWFHVPNTVAQAGFFYLSCKIFETSRKIMILIFIHNYWNRMIFHRQIHVRNSQY